MLFFLVSFDSWVLRDSHELLEIFKVEDDEDDLIEVQDFYPRVVFCRVSAKPKIARKLRRTLKVQQEEVCQEVFWEFFICNRCDISGCFTLISDHDILFSLFFPYMIMLAFCKTSCIWSLVYCYSCLFSGPWILIMLTEKVVLVLLHKAKTMGCFQVEIR